MSFEWIKLHKWEDNIERDIISNVEEYICEYYNVEMIDFLSEDQVKDIRKFSKNEVSEHSFMQIGFTHVIEMWAAARSDHEMFDIESLDDDNDTE